MPGYLITYDLKKPGRDYQPLFDVLQKTWGGGRVAESVWIANLKGPASAVREALKSVMDSNDRVFVLEIKPNSDWAAFRALQPGLNILKTISP